MDVQDSTPICAFYMYQHELMLTVCTEVGTSSLNGPVHSYWIWSSPLHLLHCMPLLKDLFTPSAHRMIFCDKALQQVLKNHITTILACLGRFQFNAMM